MHEPRLLHSSPHACDEESLKEQSWNSGQVKGKIAREALTSQEGIDAAVLARQILTLKTDLQDHALKYASGPLILFLFFKTSHWF